MRYWMNIKHQVDITAYIWNSVIDITNHMIILWAISMIILWQCISIFDGKIMRGAM